MGKIAAIFPGQGSQYAGMGKELAEEFAVCRRTFEEADAALGFQLSRLCFEGPEDQLRLTENTQPAILTTSVAIWRLLAEHGFKPDYVAGHSLGEYSALVASGSLSFKDAVVLVRKRGRYMQEAVPVGAGAMAAILGLDPQDVWAICKEASQGEVVSPANINAPGQVVIAGTAEAVLRASELARQRGRARVVGLPVSAPFHCELMMPAQQRLMPDLEAVEFKGLSFPLVTNVDASLIRDGGQARAALARQVSAPVLWQQCVEALAANGVDCFVEIGPGKVLSGLVRKISPSASVHNVEDRRTFEAFLEAFYRRQVML